MKNICKVKAIHRIAGIIAFVAIIGFSMAACGGGGDDPGIIPGHTHTPGAAATCTTAQTCMVCGEVIVAALGHNYANWKLTGFTYLPASPYTITLTETGTCIRCGETDTRNGSTITPTVNITASGTYAQTGSVLISGTINDMIETVNATAIYIANNTTIISSGDTALYTYGYGGPVTITGGGTNISISSGWGSGIAAIGDLVINGVMGTITSSNGCGIYSTSNLTISGTTGIISGSDYGIFINGMGSVTISGSIGNNDYASINGGVEAQIYIGGTDYGTSPTDPTRFPVMKQWP